MRSALEESEAVMVARYGEARRLASRAILADAIFNLATAGQRNAEKLRVYAEATCIKKLAQP